MNFQQVMKLNVLHKSKLYRIGYSETKYYCGNWGFMPFWTYVRNLLQNLGVCFPFNSACYLHDLAYFHARSLTDKLKADYKFLQDMKKIINHIKHKQKPTKEEKIILYNEKYLVRRMWAYFLIVSVGLTPVWVLWQKIKPMFSKKK